MRLPVGGTGSPYYPKILGTYEHELEEIINRLCGLPFDRIINLGAGEGYYSVGFCYRNPKNHVIAFEMTDSGRQNIAINSAANRVSDRVVLRGYCGPRELRDSLEDAENPLLIVDIEGGEIGLLNPVKFPQLLRAHVVVEVHDFVNRFIGSVLELRFEPSHDITEIWCKKRTLSDYPFAVGWLAHWSFKTHLLSALRERYIDNMRWFYMQPRLEEG